MSSKRKCQVHLIKTKGIGHLFTYKNKLTLSRLFIDAQNSTTKYKHLYMTYDDVIKEGDWYIDDTNTVRKAITSNITYWESRKDYKKIIATTDTSLLVSRDNSHKNSIWKLDGALLPQPSQQFIEKYIEAWNSGNPIKYVDVLYTQVTNLSGSVDCGDIDDDYDWTEEVLKVDSHNCITITKIKDSWTREEVIKLFEKFEEDRNHFFAEDAADILPLEYWINKNL